MPGTPRAKSASFVSANSFSCRPGMVYSASALRSWGDRGESSSDCSSPAMRTVGGRPTLRSRSEPCLSIIALIDAWKNGGAGLGGGAAGADWGARGSVMGSGLHAEEDLAELDRLRVLD